jgi:2-iminobutanoate/2-iminopropanoate deaminase
LVKRIRTEKAPQPSQDGIRLPISQAVHAGNFVFVSGQIGAKPETGKLVAGGVAKQTRQCLENLGAILDSAGLGLSHVVKMTIFIRRPKDFQKMNKIYRKYFKTEFPARICVVSSFTMNDMLVEMDAIAFSQRSSDK